MAGRIQHGWPEGVREVAAMKLAELSPPSYDLPWADQPEDEKAVYRQAADVVLRVAENAMEGRAYGS
jgi:hypothetical protein